MESKMKHLEIIQNVITRMAGNSFSLRGWAVTLVAGIFALASKDSDQSFLLIAYIPIFAFAGLDAYYLLQERLFRALYNKVRMLPDEQIDFRMDTSDTEFRTGTNTSNKYSSCLRSTTIMAFYLPLLAVTTILIIAHF